MAEIMSTMYRYTIEGDKIKSFTKYLHLVKGQ